MSQKLVVQISPNFLRLLPVAVVPSSSDDNTLCASGFVHDGVFLHNSQATRTGRMLQGAVMGRNLISMNVFV